MEHRQQRPQEGHTDGHVTYPRGWYPLHIAAKRLGVTSASIVAMAATGCLPPIWENKHWSGLVEAPAVERLVALEQDITIALAS